MTLSARSAALYSVTLVGLLALSACGKNEQQPANQPAAPSTAPAPASTAAHPAPSTTAAAAPATPAPAATAPAPATAATAASTAPAAADGFQVSTITLGDAVTTTDHKVKKEATTFSPSQKTIYVSVETTGTTPGATLNAKWTYLDKSQTIVSTSQSISADGPGVTTFRMQNPDLWPEGKYKVDISVDGKQVASKNFEVKKS